MTSPSYMWWVNVLLRHLGRLRRGLAMIILCGVARPSTKRQEKLPWVTRALTSPGQRKISCLSRRKKGCYMNPTTNSCNSNNPWLLLLLPCTTSVSPMFGNRQRGLCLAMLDVLLAYLLPASPRTSWWSCPKQLLWQKGQCCWVRGDANHRSE